MLKLDILSRLAGRTPLRGPFKAVGGQCWNVAVPEIGDDDADRFRSQLCLYENGVRLTAAHQMRAVIEAWGGGRYIHWENGLFFSITDGSDPNSNGRTYAYDFSLGMDEWESDRRERQAQRWLKHPEGKRFLELGGAEIPPPLIANLGLTNKCNLRCEICGSQKFLDETGVRRRHLELDTFEAVASTLFPLLSQVELNSQGDPLLHPNIERILETIEWHRCETKIQHNGTLLSDRLIDLIMRQHGDLMLSLDAVGSRFDEVRRGGNWEKARPGLERMLRERDPKRLSIGVYPTITQRTIGEVLNIANWCAEKGVDTLVFHRYVPIQRSTEQPPSDDAYQRVREDLAKWCVDNNDPLTVQFEGDRLNRGPLPSRRTEFADKDKALALIESGRLMFPTEFKAPGSDYFTTCASPDEYVEIGLEGQIGACCRAQDVALGRATSVEEFAAAWFGENYGAIRRSLRRGAAGSFPLPNCAGCMKFFAPREAGDRAAVDYSTPPAPGEDRLRLFVKERVDIEVIQRERGHCHIARFPTGLPDSLQLWEDETLLGPAAASHDEIRTVGKGAHSINATAVYFSTSDGSDARRNGRTYTLRLHPLGARRFDLKERGLLEIEAATHEQGECFVASFPVNLGSDLFLWEDDRRLGPSAAKHEEIRAIGSGAYNISGSAVHFSSSDGTDPRRNGRAYTLRPHPLGAARFDLARNGAFELEVIKSEKAHCYVAEFPFELNSEVELWEGDKPLGPSGALHDEIRKEGRGRYHVGAKSVYFSTSDGSDARRNGRIYTLRVKAKSFETA